MLDSHSVELMHRSAHANVDHVRYDDTGGRSWIVILVTLGLVAMVAIGVTFFLVTNAFAAPTGGCGGG